jgi:hypothetical protein
MATKTKLPTMTTAVDTFMRIPQSLARIMKIAKTKIVMKESSLLLQQVKEGSIWRGRYHTSHNSVSVNSFILLRTIKKGIAPFIYWFEGQ